MKQMVYVVLDDGEVVGVYDEYTEAENVASETATITPVIVGQTDEFRVGCENPHEVLCAVERELKNMGTLPQVENEEEEDDFNLDDLFYDEEEEEEEEVDPIEEMVYEMDGKRVISKDDATDIAKSFAAFITEQTNIPEEEQQAYFQQLMLDFAETHGIWGVDMR